MQTYFTMKRLLLHTLIYILNKGKCTSSIDTVDGQRCNYGTIFDHGGQTDDDAVCSTKSTNVVKIKFMP